VAAQLVASRVVLSSTELVSLEAILGLKCDFVFEVCDEIWNVTLDC
jgi:hypothetical protein